MSRPIRFWITLLVTLAAGLGGVALVAGVELGQYVMALGVLAAALVGTSLIVGRPTNSRAARAMQVVTLLAIAAPLAWMWGKGFWEMGAMWTGIAVVVGAAVVAAPIREMRAVIVVLLIIGCVTVGGWLGGLFFVPGLLLSLVAIALTPDRLTGPAVCAHRWCHRSA